MVSACHREVYLWVGSGQSFWYALLEISLIKVLVPVYVSETAPRQLRGALVATYQLFVTMGILTSYCINLGTSQVQNQSGSWRGALACTYLWAGLLASGYLPT
jgi:MFS transporter, SP family, sugar:H+ symporter